MKITIHRAAMAAACLLGGLATVGCGSSSSGDGSPRAAIAVSGAWARTSASVANAGAAYVTIQNVSGIDDALLSARTDPAIAASVEVHETVVAEATPSMGTGDMSTATAPAGMMEMRPVDRLALPADGTLVMKPGGYHMMLMGLSAPLVAGTTITVTLTFEKAGDKVVTFDVRDTAP